MTYFLLVRTCDSSDRIALLRTRCGFCNDESNQLNKGQFCPRLRRISKSANEAQPQDMGTVGNRACYVYVYVHTCIYICMYLCHMYLYLVACICVGKYSGHLRMHMHIHSHRHTHIHVRIHIYVYRYVTRIYTSTYMYLYIYTLISIQIHTYTPHLKQPHGGTHVQFTATDGKDVVQRHFLQRHGPGLRPHQGPRGTGGLGPRFGNPGRPILLKSLRKIRYGPYRCRYMIHGSIEEYTYVTDP